MSIVRMGRCASCGTPVLWLRAWGFGEPRPLELSPAPDGQVVIDPDESLHRAFLAGSPTEGRHRYRLHWPCPATTGGPGPGAARAAARARGERLLVGIVPHTHWDREWYAPFQTYRLRLVRVMDDVLDALEADPSFSSFLLDGQTAMVDDYLEVRPEAEERIRRLAVAGRLALGPWRSQPDEFMVSGETLVRDLQTGLARAAELGRTLDVGYLPDSFGHVAQMPQILAAAGIGHAVVFRGVPESVGSTGFWWEAPDGSRVRAEHMALGYTNAIRMADDPAALVARAHDLEATLGAHRVGGLLLMNGGDHEGPRRWVGRLAAEADALDSDLHFEMADLQAFVEAQPVDDLPVWRGELRASGPSTVIMGVTSNHVDVKLAAAAAERAVERRAEPLSALLLAPERYPERLLELAWARLVDNAAHDSACACSADEVVDQVKVRYAEARQIGEGLTDEAVAALATAVDAPAGSRLVVNPGSHRRAGAVRFPAVGTGPVHLQGPAGELLPAQVLATAQALEMEAAAPGADLDVLLDLFGTGSFAGHRVAHWWVDGNASGTLVLEMAGPSELPAPLTEAAAILAEWGRVRPDHEVRVVLLRPPLRDVLALTAPVPGFGWSAHRVAEGEGPSSASAVTAGERWAANEHLSVEVDPADGTLSLTTAGGLRATGLNRYVDEGDAGDTYNWSPPAGDLPIDRPERVTIEVVETGPVRARLVVTALYPWAAPTEVRTTVDVVAGEPFVRVTAELNNAHRDHRLRAHFPLPAPVEGSDAECAYAVVHRGLLHEGNPVEHGLPTWPARRFVDCSDGTVGLALVHDGVGEYEVVAEGRELALTLLRTVGFLSRDDGSMRPVEAGPPIPIPSAEQLGPFRRSYAVFLHTGAWEDARLFEVADAVLLPFEHTAVAAGGTAGTVPASGTRLEVQGAEVTAVLRQGPALFVRLVRASDRPGRAEVRLDGEPVRAWAVDLRGGPVAAVEGALELRPWEIATLRIDAP